MMPNTYETGKFYLQQNVSVGDIKGQIVSVRICPGTNESYRIYELNWFHNGDLKQGYFYEWQLEA